MAALAVLAIATAGCSSSSSAPNRATRSDSAFNTEDGFPPSYTLTDLPIGKPFCVQGTVLYAVNTPYLIGNADYSAVLFNSGDNCPNYPVQSGEVPTTQYFIVTRTGPDTFVSTRDGGPEPTTAPDGSGRWYDLQPLSSVKASTEALDQLYAVSALAHMLTPGQQRYISLADVGDTQERYEMLGDIPTSPQLYDSAGVGDDMAGISVTHQGRLQLCLPVGDSAGDGLTSRTVAPGIVNDIGAGYLPGGLFYPIVRTDGHGCTLPQTVHMPNSFEVTSLAPGQTGFGDCGFYRTPSGKAFYQIYGDPYMSYIGDDQPLSTVPLPSAATGPNILTEDASVLYRNPVTRQISALVTPTCPLQTNLYPLIIQK